MENFLQNYVGYVIRIRNVLRDTYSYLSTRRPIDILTFRKTKREAKSTIFCQKPSTKIWVFLFKMVVLKGEKSNG